MTIRKILVGISSVMLILPCDFAGAFSLPALKPLCEVVALASSIVIGEQASCTIPDVDNEALQPPGGPDALVEFSVQETLLGSTLMQGQNINIKISGHCLEQNHTYILLLHRHSEYHIYRPAYGLNDIHEKERKEEVLECIRKNQE
jgi:hypothetical protein